MNKKSNFGYNPMQQLKKNPRNRMESYFVTIDVNIGSNDSFLDYILRATKQKTNKKFDYQIPIYTFG
jgi:hypothetical protein